MQEIRCKHCGKLLMRVDAKNARVETVCPDRRCRTLQTHVLTTPGKPAST